MGSFGAPVEAVGVPSEEEVVALVEVKFGILVEVKVGKVAKVGEVEAEAEEAKSSVVEVVGVVHY